MILICLKILIFIAMLYSLYRLLRVNEDNDEVLERLFDDNEFGIKKDIGKYEAKYYLFIFFLLMIILSNI